MTIACVQFKSHSLAHQSPPFCMLPLEAFQPPVLTLYSKCLYTPEGFHDGLVFFW